MEETGNDGPIDKEFEFSNEAPTAKKFEHDDAIGKDDYEGVFAKKDKDQDEGYRETHEDESIYDGDIPDYASKEKDFEFPDDPNVLIDGLYQLATL